MIEFFLKKVGKKLEEFESEVSLSTSFIVQYKNHIYFCFLLLFSCYDSSISQTYICIHFWDWYKYNTYLIHIWHETILILTTHIYWHKNMLKMNEILKQKMKKQKKERIHNTYLTQKKEFVYNLKKMKSTENKKNDHSHRKVSILFPIIFYYLS